MARRWIKTDARVFQLKITLKGSKPPIRRRVQVRGDMSLDELHDVFQIVMGWENSHLHQFIISGERFGMKFDGAFDEAHDEATFTLAQVVDREKSKFVYEYDFGDGWTHDVLVESIGPSEAGVTLPRCLDGKQACPPEDCGGLWGFYNLLEVVGNPRHPEHHELSDWLGKNYDPNVFDVDAVNRRLSQAFGPRKTAKKVTRPGP